MTEPKYGTAFQTDTESILAAKKWCHEIIQNNSSPRVDVTDENFRYAIESTGNYMTPITLLWGGKPSIINPNIAKAGMVKSDILDSYTLAVHNLTGTWPQSFVISTDVQTLRVLIAERDNCNKLATRCSNRIVNLLLKFGYTIARDGSIVKKKELREFVEDQLSDTPQIKPLSDKIRIPDDAKCIFHDLYNDYDELKRRVAEYDKRIQKKIKSMEWDTEHGKVDGKRMLEVLTSAPGVGPQTAAIWLAYVVTPMRFATVNKCAAYCGFDPSNKVSAGKVTSNKKRKGQKHIHALLCQCGHSLIQNHSEALGLWGYQLKCQGSEKKAKSAVGRRLCVALYFMQMRNEMFNYDLYLFAREPKVIDIPIEKLCELEPEFKRYMKTMISNGITTTKQMAHLFHIGELNNIKGFGKKAYSLIREFIGNQRRYVRLLHNSKKEENDHAKSSKDK